MSNPPSSPAQAARAMFESGWYCTEAVLQALADDQGIESDVIPRIATGFTAGIARTSGLCGAVSGAIMGLSLALGRQSPDDSVEDTFAAVQALLDRFEQQHHTTNCQQLIGVDLKTPAGQAEFRAQGKGPDCAGYVELATQLAHEILAEHRNTE